MKGSAAVERMDPLTVAGYGRLCAWPLARAHARSADAVAIAGYLGSGNVFDQAIVGFAGSYADQNEADYAAFAEAAAQKRLTVAEG